MFGNWYDNIFEWWVWINCGEIAKEKNDSIRSSAENHSLSAGTSIGSHPSLEVVGKSNVHGDSQCLNPEDNFELSVLGREVQANDTDDHNSEDGLLGDMEHMNRISSRSIGDLGSFANKDQERAAEGDDFLQELEKIERSVRSGAAKDRGILDDVRFGAVNNDSIELSTDLGDYNATKGMESDLDDDEAIFYRYGLGFVTNTGFLEIPGLGDLENQELDKPYQFRPDRLYYPGQTYAPEDFDISRPTEERDEPISRIKKVHSSGEVWERSDFRNVRFLSQFITDTSRLHPRRTNMVSAKAQRKIVREIKTARAFGLVPFTSMGEPPYSFLRSRRVEEFDSDDEDDDYDVDDDGGNDSAQKF